MYVPFFRCESFPYISRRADRFPCALFPFPSPCTPLVFISVPCMSLAPLFPFRVPPLSCHVDFLFPPLISLHFLAFPLCSPKCPAKNTVFSSVFAIRTSKNTELFPDFLQKLDTVPPAFSRLPTRRDGTQAGGWGSVDPRLRTLRHAFLLVEGNHRFDGLWELGVAQN